MGYSFAPEPPEKIYGKPASAFVMFNPNDPIEPFDSEKGTIAQYMRFAFAKWLRSEATGFELGVTCFRWLHAYARFICFAAPDILADPAIDFIPIDESRKVEWLSENNPEAIAADFLKTLKP